MSVDLMLNDQSRCQPALPGKASVASLPALDALFAAAASLKSLCGGDTLARQGETAQSLHKVVRGLVRVCIYTEDGDRKIVRFAAPGAILGLTDHGEWSYTLEAVGPAAVSVLARTRFEQELRRNSALREDVWAGLTEEIAARDALLILVTCTHAAERVLAFLHYFAEGRDAAGFVELPMGRHDIADYLGLSMETVSRAFSSLRDCGAIELKGPSLYRVLHHAARTEQHAA
ncbi:Crp/Fnr family transcriptional regulator [Aestuariibius sp. 2305UL40-4]|uniref:Crp/Fnr family transcriptional regulator n=1 Tax=Aestuariibius violaceus TaxID=3234132 RepID=UPI00345E7F15